MKRLLEMFEEPTGGISSTRVVYLLWFLYLIAAGVYLTIKNSAFPAIPTETIGLSVALMGGKWAQRREEAKNETTVN